MRARPDVPYEELASYFIYDPEEGSLVWRRRDPATMYHGESWNRRFAGKPAGGYNPSDGHIYVSVARRFIAPTARVIWCLMNRCGLREAPEIVDHRDGDPRNERWSNLRAADYFRNNQNERLKSSNSTGFKNISRRCGRWRVTVYAYGKTRTDRHFICLGKALEHRNKVMQIHHKEFACGGHRRKEVDRAC